MLQLHLEYGAFHFTIGEKGSEIFCSPQWFFTFPHAGLNNEEIQHQKLDLKVTMWGHRSIAAKLVYNSNFTMVYGTYNELVTGRI